MAEDASNNGFIVLLGMIYSFIGYMVSTFIFSISYISYAIISIIATFFSYFSLIENIALSIGDMFKQAFGFLGYIVSILTYLFNIADNDEDILF